MPLSRPIRNETKPVVTRTFSTFRAHFAFLLVHWIFCVICYWPVITLVSVILHSIVNVSNETSKDKLKFIALVY